MYIKREDAIKVLSDGYAEGIIYAKEIKVIPSADVVEREEYDEELKKCQEVIEGLSKLVNTRRKRGCWRKVQHQDKTYWKCSQCGMLHKYASNYCDSCGTDMRGNNK